MCCKKICKRSNDMYVRFRACNGAWKNKIEWKRLLRSIWKRFGTSRGWNNAKCCKKWIRPKIVSIKLLEENPKGWERTAVKVVESKLRRSTVLKASWGRSVKTTSLNKKWRQDCQTLVIKSERELPARRSPRRSVAAFSPTTSERRARTRRSARRSSWRTTFSRPR